MKKIKIYDENMNKGIIACVVICIADFLFNYFVEESFSLNWFFAGMTFGIATVYIILVVLIKYKAEEIEDKEGVKNK